MTPVKSRPRRILLTILTVVLLLLFGISAVEVFWILSTAGNDGLTPQELSNAFMFYTFIALASFMASFAGMWKLTRK